MHVRVLVVCVRAWSACVRWPVSTGQCGCQLGLAKAWRGGLSADMQECCIGSVRCFWGRWRESRSAVGLRGRVVQLNRSLGTTSCRPLALARKVGMEASSNGTRGPICTPSPPVICSSIRWNNRANIQAVHRQGRSSLESHCSSSSSVHERLRVCEREQSTFLAPTELTRYSRTRPHVMDAHSLHGPNPLMARHTHAGDGQDKRRGPVGADAGPAVEVTRSRDQGRGRLRADRGAD